MTISLENVVSTWSYSRGNGVSPMSASPTCPVPEEEEEEEEEED
jgi:hypothetical protein